MTDDKKKIIMWNEEKIAKKLESLKEANVEFPNEEEIDDKIVENVERKKADKQELGDFLNKMLGEFYGQDMANVFEDYSKNAIDLIGALISHYRRSLYLKSKEVEFLQNENNLLRERVDMLKEVSSQYEDAAEQLIIDVHIPKEFRKPQEKDLPDVFEYGKSEVLEKNRKDKMNKDKMAVRHSAFTRRV